MFESTIRFIGGLLSAYDLTGTRIFLDKAEELAQRLMPAFNAPNGIPFSTINLLSYAFPWFLFSILLLILVCSSKGTRLVSGLGELCVVSVRIRLDSARVSSFGAFDKKQNVFSAS